MKILIGKNYLLISGVNIPPFESIYMKKNIILLLLLLTHFFVIPTYSSNIMPTQLSTTVAENANYENSSNSQFADRLPLSFSSTYERSLSMYIDNNDTLVVPTNSADIRLKDSNLYKRAITNSSDFWETGTYENINRSHSELLHVFSTNGGNYASYDKNLAIPVQSVNDYFTVTFDSINFTLFEDEFSFAGITFVFTTPTKEFKISAIATYNNYTKNLFKTLVYPDLEKYYFLENTSTFSLSISEVKTVANVSEVSQLSEIYFTAYRPAGLMYNISISKLNFYYLLPDFQSNLSPLVLESYNATSHMLLNTDTLYFNLNVTGFVNLTLVLNINDVLLLNISRNEFSIDYVTNMHFNSAPFEFDTVDINLPLQMQNSTFITSEFSTTISRFNRTQISNNDIIVTGNLLQAPLPTKIYPLYQGMYNSIENPYHILKGDVFQGNLSYSVNITQDNVFYIPNFFMKGSAYFLGYNLSGFAFLLTIDFPFKAIYIDIPKEVVYNPLTGTSVNVYLSDYHTTMPINNASIQIYNFPYYYKNQILTLLPSNHIKNTTFIFGSVFALGYVVRNFTFSITTTELNVTWSAESDYLGNSLFSLVINIDNFNLYTLPLTLSIKNNSYALTSQNTTIFLLSNITRTFDVTLSIGSLQFTKSILFIVDEALDTLPSTNSSVNNISTTFITLSTVIGLSSFTFVIQKYLKKRNENINISF